MCALNPFKGNSSHVLLFYIGKIFMEFANVDFDCVHINAHMWYLLLYPKAPVLRTLQYPTPLYNYSYLVSQTQQLQDSPHFISSLLASLLFDNPLMGSLKLIHVMLVSYCYSWKGLSENITH